MGYWTTCKVTECVPGEVFKFAVIMGERPVNTWRYEFQRQLVMALPKSLSHSTSATISSPRSGARSVASSGNAATGGTCSPRSNGVRVRHGAD